MTTPFHIGIVVQDLDAAMLELTQVADVHWGDPIERVSGDWSYRLVYSIEGPPHIELIQLVDGPPGAPWDASEGPRLDHAGWWTVDVSEEMTRLELLGMEVDFDLRELPGGNAVYMRGPATGLRFELNNRASREFLYERLGRTPPAEG